MKQIVFLKYWGSRFRHPRQVDIWRGILASVTARGWRCLFVLERAPDDLGWTESLQREGIELVYLPRPKRHFDLGCVRRVFSLCRQYAVDIIHCENMFVSPLLGAAMARVPVRLWTKNNMDPHFAECRPATLREKVAISTRVGCAVATRTVAVSQPVANELVELGISANRIVLQLNPRTGITRRAHDADRRRVRQQLGLGDEEVVFVAVGHAVPVKGWDLLLRAFREVAAVSPRARLLLVGSFTADHERACAAELLAYIQNENLAGKVTMVGHVHDVPSYLAASDVFVLPSRCESFAYVLIEALEIGLPCVTARVGAAEHAVRNGINGFIVERNDWQGLARQLILLSQDQQLRNSFAAESRVPVDFPAIAEYGERFARLYQSLLPSHASLAASPQPSVVDGR